MHITHTVKNIGDGLQLLLIPLEQSPSVTVSIFAGVGARHEDAAENGISHIIEHMAFKGTTHRPTRTIIDEEIASIGGESNAGTGYEFTYYYVKVPAYQWKKALDIVSDLTLNPTYPEEELEKEKTVIVQEYRMYEDNPQRKLHAEFRDLMWPDHPLGRRISGDPQTIMAATCDSMRIFRNRHYTRNNLLIAISGNFDEAQVESFVREYFAALPKGEPVSVVPADTTQPRDRFLHIKRKQEATDMLVGFKGFNRTQQEDLDVLGVMNTILGGGSNSRLFRRVRDELGLSYYIGSGHTDYVDDGVLYVAAGVMPDNVSAALEAMLVECQKMAQEPVTQKELHTAKEYLKGRMLMDLETSDDILQFFAFQQLLEPGIRTPDELLARLDVITAEDILRVAQEIFVPGNVYFGMIGNSPTGVSKEVKKLVGGAFR